MTPAFTVEIGNNGVILRNVENPEVFTTIFLDECGKRRLGRFLADFEDPTPVADDGEPSDTGMEAYTEQAARIRNQGRTE